MSGYIQEFFGLKRNYRALSDSWWHHRGLSNFWETYPYKEIISSGSVSWRFNWLEPKVGDLEEVCLIASSGKLG